MTEDRKYNLVIVDKHFNISVKKDLNFLHVGRILSSDNYLLILIIPPIIKIYDFVL